MTTLPTGLGGQFAQGSNFAQTTSSFGQGQGQTVTQGQGSYGQVRYLFF